MSDLETLGCPLFVLMSIGHTSQQISMFAKSLIGKQRAHLVHQPRSVLVYCGGLDSKKTRGPNHACTPETEQLLSRTI